MKHSTALSLAISLALAGSTFAAEDIDNGYGDYTINRTFEDLKKSPKDLKAAKRIVFGCYLGCHRPAKEEVPETLSPKLEGFNPQWFLDQWFSMDNERHAGISSQMKEIVYANPPRDMASTAILLGAQKMKYNPMPDVLESEEFKRGKETYDRTCKACHGEQGASTQKNFPPLKGQMPTYIYEQMIAYRDGKRTNGALAGIMMPYAKMLSDQDYRDVAAYVSGQRVKPIEKEEFITGIGMPAPKGFKLPETGQIQNFTDTFGEDSDYQGNEPSYTISESGKVVLDNNTQLMWERDSSRIWMTAVEGKEYCANLEIDGYTDWRFPLMKELFSIADMGEFRPAINTDVFLNMPRQNSGIWTFPVSDRHDHVWHVGFPDAHIMGQHTASTKLVRCVRADNDAAYHNMQYVDNGDGTVTEKVTNRMWQQNIDYVKRKFDDSLKYCQDLEYAGYDDWRTPDIKEMNSIVNYNKVSPAIDEEFFPNTPVKSFFWTSTSDVAGPTLHVRPLSARKKNQTPEQLDLRFTGDNEGWAHGYLTGQGFGMSKDSEFYTRCVRNP
ncbi:TPA: DUF1566 domain-containing protein [Vibrio harveyi]|nr:DUF1566 domain-containing protein [Vibrio harveyi]